MSACRFGEFFPRTNDRWTYCKDCGCVVFDAGIHQRFHDILGDSAIAIALTLTAHVSERRHNTWDLLERVRAKQTGNNWSAEAFEEVTGLNAVGDEECGARKPIAPGDVGPTYCYLTKGHAAHHRARWAGDGSSRNIPEPTWEQA